MERVQSPANSPEVEEIPHISTLNLPQLEASLAQQEGYSKDALADAFAGKQDAERHREAVIQCEADARASQSRYEEAELVIHELRKAIVEQNKKILESGSEPGCVRALQKRQHVSDILCCISVGLLPKLTFDVSPRAQNRTCQGSELHP
jgi:hypothetical protein